MPRSPDAQHQVMRSTVQQARDMVSAAQAAKDAYDEEYRLVWKGGRPTAAEKQELRDMLDQVNAKFVEANGSVLTNIGGFTPKGVIPVKAAESKFAAALGQEARPSYGFYHPKVGLMSLSGYDGSLYLHAPVNHDIGRAFKRLTGGDVYQSDVMGWVHSIDDLVAAAKSLPPLPTTPAEISSALSDAQAEQDRGDALRDSVFRRGSAKEFPKEWKEVYSMWHQAAAQFTEANMQALTKLGGFTELKGKDLEPFGVMTGQGVFHHPVFGDVLVTAGGDLSLDHANDVVKSKYKEKGSSFSSVSRKDVMAFAQEAAKAAKEAPPVAQPATAKSDQTPPEPSKAQNAAVKRTEDAMSKHGWTYYKGYTDKDGNQEDIWIPGPLADTQADTDTTGGIAVNTSSDGQVSFKNHDTGEKGGVDALHAYLAQHRGAKAVATPTTAPAKAVAKATATATAPQLPNEQAAPQAKPSIAQQRAMVSPQQAAIAHKSSTEYLSAAGWQRQASGPDGTTWSHPKFGEVTLAKDGWLELPNDVKVRPERVGLYLQGLAQGTATLAPSSKDGDLVQPTAGEKRSQPH
jgi:hypothetical protein